MDVFQDLADTELRLIGGGFRGRLARFREHEDAGSLPQVRRRASVAHNVVYGCKGGMEEIGAVKEVPVD